MFYPQLVFLAVILTLLVTCADGQVKQKILTYLALSSGMGQQTPKALDLRMTSPNLDVSRS